MRNTIFTVIFVLLTTSVFAQNKKVGYYNGDSLLRLMPGYEACLDSTRMYHDSMRVELERMEKDKTIRQREMDSLQGKVSPLITKLQAEQLRQVKDNIEQYKRLSSAEIQTLDSLRKAPFEQRLLDAKNAAAKKNNCTAAYDKKAINFNATPIENIYLDLNAEVAEELKLK